MPAGKKKTKSNKKNAEEKVESFAFEPISVHIKEITTAIHLLSCQEESVILAALISLNRYVAKGPHYLEIMQEKGLKPINLLKLAFEARKVIPPSSQVRVFAAKLVTWFVKIPRIRQELPQGPAYCLASLQRHEGDPMDEYSSNVLAELTKGPSITYASSLLICPPLKLDHPLKVLFTRITTTKDPDVIHNCLRNIWQLLVAASAAPEKRHYIQEIYENLNLAALPPLFKSIYPSIQLLSMAISYEVSFRYTEAVIVLSTSLPSLLEILESPSDRLIHCTTLALIRTLVASSPPQSQQPMNDKSVPQEDRGIPFVACGGPGRLLAYLKQKEKEPGDIRFWTLSTILALFSSPSAAAILINHHQFHSELENLLKDEDGHIAVAAAYAIRCMERYPMELEKIAKSPSPKHLASLVARWPGDESVPPYLSQTFEGCSVAAKALEFLVRQYPSAISSLASPEEADPVQDVEHPEVPATLTPLPRKEKISKALHCLQDVIERVGKLPDECITSVLGTTSILASVESLRPAIASSEAFVSCLIHCLVAPPYCPVVKYPPEIPVEWPIPSVTLERILVERFAKEGVWEPRNPAPKMCDPSMKLKDAACVALGNLMPDPSFTDIFVSLEGAERIRNLLKKNESGFGREMFTNTLLIFIANCSKCVANAFVENGTLKWMIDEGASRRTRAIVSSWNAAIANLLRSNPSIKFQVTGRLNPDENTGDIFYVVCPPPPPSSLLEPIETYRAAPSQPHRHVFLACWSLRGVCPPRIERRMTSKSVMRRRESMLRSMGKLESVELKTGMGIDNDLFSFESTLKDELQRSKFGVEEIVRILARFVWEMMAGPLRDAVFEKERHLEQLKIEINQGDVIPLGKVRMGSYTERAILFKVLADRIGLPVALVRGSYGRSWIEVTLLNVPIRTNEDEMIPTLDENLCVNTDDFSMDRKSEFSEDVMSSDPKRGLRETNKNDGRKKASTSVSSDVMGEDFKRKSTMVKRSQSSAMMGKRRRTSMIKSISFQGDLKRISEMKMDRALSEAVSLSSRIPQAKLFIPLGIIQPNHVVDLMTRDGSLYPIGSREANIYCGYEFIDSESGVNIPCCVCEDDFFSAYYSEGRRSEENFVDPGYEDDEEESGDNDFEIEVDHEDYDADESDRRLTEEIENEIDKIDF